MRVGTGVQMLLIAFAGCAAPAMAGGWNVPCGGLDKAPCAFNAAKLEGKQTSGLCAAGQFFDLIQGGTCWSCPAAYGRTVFAVDTGKACRGHR